MPNPLAPLLAKVIGPQPIPRLKRMAVGLAQDFWKDGPDNPFTGNWLFPLMAWPKKKKSRSTRRDDAFSDSLNDQKLADNIPGQAQSAQPATWHAEAGEISEKMWGDGFVTPGDDVFTDMLVNPLGLTKEMSVLDLSAGLGGRLRRTTEETGAYITGLEPDQHIAARGMELSVRAGKAKHAAVTHYDPNNFAVPRRFDCMVARETFYRVVDRETFFASLSLGAKPNAQIAFTDYIVNPEDKDKPAIKAWLSFEKGANPASLVEMVGAWSKVGFRMRVNDDQTDIYKQEIAKGMRRLALFLATGPKPDAETKAALQRRVQTWAYRFAAMNVGMKFVRFYGIKRPE